MCCWLLSSEVIQLSPVSCVLCPCRRFSLTLCRLFCRLLSRVLLLCMVVCTAHLLAVRDPATGKPLLPHQLKAEIAVFMAAGGRLSLFRCGLSVAAGLLGWKASHQYCFAFSAMQLQLPSCVGTPPAVAMASSKTLSP